MIIFNRYSQYFCFSLKNVFLYFLYLAAQERSSNSCTSSKSTWINYKWITCLSTKTKYLYFVTSDLCPPVLPHHGLSRAGSPPPSKFLFSACCFYYHATETLSFQGRRLWVRFPSTKPKHSNTASSDPLPQKPTTNMQTNINFHPWLLILPTHQYGNQIAPHPVLCLPSTRGIPPSVTHPSRW